MSEPLTNKSVPRDDEWSCDALRRSCDASGALRRQAGVFVASGFLPEKGMFAFTRTQPKTWLISVTFLSHLAVHHLGGFL